MAPTDQQSDDVKETAMAQLALQLGQKNTVVVGAEPSDEELAALYENRLDTTRRAQIMGHIANSSEVYQRWIACVEALVYMEEVETQSTIAVDSTSKKSSTFEADQQSKPQGFVGSLIHWISGHRAGVFGGGFATAAIALMVVLLFPFQKEVNVQQHLDDAYLSWGILLNDEWAAFPDDKKPQQKFSGSRSFFAKPKPKSEIQQVIETGFKKGVDKIGKDAYKGFGIDVDNLVTLNVSQATGFTGEQFTALTQTGQLASITAIQCKLDPTSQRITNLYPVAISLTKQIKTISHDQIQKLVSGVEGIADKNLAVCQFTDNTLILMQAD